MSILLRDRWAEQLRELRYEPTEKWVRARLGGREVVSTRRALLVWEPRRIVPSYAVPVSDLAASLQAAQATAEPATAPILHPGFPFGVHSAAGAAFDLVIDGVARPGAGFQVDELPGYLVLDFGAFDQWLEEDEELLAHPRDPYSRLDIRPSSRHVRIFLDGVLLADSRRPTLVFETHLPPRFYLPAEDVTVPLTPSKTVTSCAYKGTAAYHSVPGGTDLVWTYPDPLPEARRLAGLIAFFDERVDVTVDGEERARPAGAVADALRDEFG